MDGFAIREKNHPKVAPLCLWNLDPPADAAISLHQLFDRSPDGPFDPHFEDPGPIRSVPKRLKVACGLHFQTRPTMFLGDLDPLSLTHDGQFQALARS